MQARPDLQLWIELVPYGAPQNVSTLTTLLAFTDYGTLYQSLCVFLSNDDPSNPVTLVVDVSHGGAKKIEELTHTVEISAGAEGYADVGSPNPFTFLRIAAQTASPGFPTVPVRWALLGLPRLRQ